MLLTLLILKIKLPLKQIRRNPFYDLSGGTSNSDLLQLVGLAGDGSHNRKAFNNLTGTPNLRIHGYTDAISDSGVEELFFDDLNDLHWKTNFLTK